jgi:hypothetical protein
MLSLVGGCGSKTQLTVVPADDASALPDVVVVADTLPPVDTAPPPPPPPPPPMTCADDESPAFVMGSVAGESFMFDRGFTGGTPDGGKCSAQWVLIFTDQRCIVAGEEVVPSLYISIRGDPLFASGVVYMGEATLVTERGFATFEVEVLAEELVEPFSRGRARGTVMAEEFMLFGDFDLPMDPDLVDLPFCA